MLKLPYVIDLDHFENKPDFAGLKESDGVVGVILKATQGTHFVDPRLNEWFPEATAVFGHGNVHVYHFLDGSDALLQVDHFVSNTEGVAFRWLDYEQNAPSQCTLEIALEATHILAAKQGFYPGVYGSEGDLLGAAMATGHFTGTCPIWAAAYSLAPKLPCNLWQWAAGEDRTCVLQGQGLDASTYDGTAAECAVWMASLGRAA